MNESLNNSLEQLRGQIDNLDSKILALIQARVSVAIQMGEVKKLEGRAIRDTAREEQIIRRLEAENITHSSSLSNEDIQAVFSLLMNICLKVQSRPKC